MIILIKVAASNDILIKQIIHKYTNQCSYLQSQNRWFRTSTDADRSAWVARKEFTNHTAA